MEEIEITPKLILALIVLGLLITFILSVLSCKLFGVCWGRDLCKLLFVKYGFIIKRPASLTCSWLPM
ncbi:MAG: hypothetical protein J7K26_03345 [Candidatus Aenigmarchaeota archaeon]|nr:hypothetical protein [Candidatus Aenigmarchaeota archaeon]